MNESSLARLDTYLADSLATLLAAHGFEPKPEMASEAPDRSIDAGGYRVSPEADRGWAHRDGDFGATIGFTGDRLRGALVVSLGRRTLISSLPTRPGRKHEDDEMLADWAGELANQLLGRLKNGLWSSGIEVALGTPVTFVGFNLEHFSPDPMVLRRSTCLVETGRVVVELEMDCAADIELAEAQAGNEGPFSGDVSLF